MTDAELRAFVAEARAQVEEKLAAIAEVDLDALPMRIREEVEAARRECLDLLATLSDESIDAEVEACAHAGRPLSQAEVAALVRRGRAAPSH